MAKQWQPQPGKILDKSKGDQIETSSTTLTGGTGNLIGRVIVEEFATTKPGDDGIYYRVSFPASSDPKVIQNYARELVKKLSTRLG